MSRVLFFLFTVTLAIGLDHPALSQDQPRLLRLETLKVSETDSLAVQLTKKCFNATKREVEAKINLWNQEIIQVDGVIDALNRLHLLRHDIEIMPDQLSLAEDKVKAAKYLLEKCKASKARRLVLKETNTISLEAYHLQCQLEKLKIEQKKKRN